MPTLADGQPQSLNDTMQLPGHAPTCCPAPAAWAPCTMPAAPPPPDPRGPAGDATAQQRHQQRSDGAQTNAVAGSGGQLHAACAPDPASACEAQPMHAGDTPFHAASHARTAAMTHAPHQHERSHGRARLSQARNPRGATCACEALHRQVRPVRDCLYAAQHGLPRCSTAVLLQL